MSVAPALRLVAAAILIAAFAPGARAAPLPIPAVTGVRVQAFGSYSASRAATVLVRAPATFSIPLTVPASGWLISAVAVPDQVWTANVTDSAQAVRFRVLFESGEVVTALYDRTVDIAERAGDRRWFEFGRDLSQWAGQRGTLHFETTLADPRAKPNTLALWAPPDVASCDGSKPSLLLVVVDSLRGDRLRAAGYRRRTTPNLDAFAAGATRFAAAFSAAPKAIPAVPQILSGKAFLREQGMPRPSPLFGPGRFTTSRAIVANPYVSFLLKPGPASFQTVVAGTLDARAITREALRWLRAAGRCQHASYVHYFDTHTPYRPPERYARKFIDPNSDSEIDLEFGDVTGTLQDDLSKADEQRVIDLYDGAVAWTDRQIGVLLRALARHGVLDHTIVIVTADHGQELWDHREFSYGQSLYDELLRVPLIIRHPAHGHGRTVSSIASSLDLVPTVVEAAGFPSTEGDGTSLVAALGGEAAADDGRTVFATVSVADPRTPPRHAVRSLKRKLIRNVDDGSIQVYDLAADPREKRNLGPAAPAAPELLAALDATRARIANVGHQLRIASRSDRRMRYTVTLTPDPVAPIYDPDRLTLERNDQIRVGAMAGSLTVSGTLDPTEEDHVRMDIISAGKLDVAITLDGAAAPEGTLRVGASRHASGPRIDLADESIIGAPAPAPPADTATSEAPTPGADEPEITVHFWRSVTNAPETGTAPATEPEVRSSPTPTDAREEAPSRPSG